ncbi:MAG: radical SAM protein [Candidatus Binatia bacterium]
MQHLVIKPTLACTARCATCATRRDLHRHARKEGQFTFTDWVRVLAEARDLGVWELTISGGEPTLYAGLVDLVRIGHGYGWVVRVNTNGSLLDEPLARRLLDAGLNYIDVSLYGSHPAVHDPMRGRRGSWKEATTAIAILARLAPRYPAFRLMTQTILCRENYMDFPELLRLHHRLGSTGVLVSYLEGDFEQDHLLTLPEIKRFREEVLPNIESVVRGFERTVQAAALSQLRGLYSPATLSEANWARGWYRPDRGDCREPHRQALVLANGDVHPCNIVEYTHEPVVGNLFEEALATIWNGQRWCNFRRDLHPRCECCPMQRHTYVPLRFGRTGVALARWALHMLRLGHLEAALYPWGRKQLTRLQRRVRTPAT